MSSALAWLTRLSDASTAVRESDRHEWFLACARPLIALSSLIVIGEDSHLHNSPGAWPWLALYLAYCSLVLLLIRFGRKRSTRFLLMVHAADLLWPAALSAYTGGTESPYFVLFAFAILAAASRWGFGATVLSASAAALVFLIEAVVADSAAGLHGDAVLGRVHSSVFLTQILSLILLGVLVGYVAERRKRLQVENAAIRSLIETSNSQASFSETLHRVLRKILTLFGADRVLLIVRERPSGRVFAWRAGGAEGGTGRLRPKEMGASQASGFLFPLPGRSWYLQKRKRAGSYDFMALDEEARRLERTRCSVPRSLFESESFRTLLSVETNLDRNWSGRICLFDLKDAGGLESKLRFFQMLMNEVAPALHSAYLLRHFRERARSAERARIARDLHDGVIQSLIGLEMSVDALRRDAQRVSGEAAEKLGAVREMLREEVASLRELVQKLKLDEVSPNELPRFLTDLVDQFQRQTGIHATFSSQAETASMDPRLCRELAHIVHEALTNARKHSGAHSVRIHLATEGGIGKLVVEDDGRGFGFSGRYSQAELEASRLGPRVIQERVQSFRGELAIESFPDRGARLEVSFAPRIHG